MMAFVIIQDGVNGFLADDVETVLNTILGYSNKTEILENTRKTVYNYTEELMAKNYLDSIME